MGRNTYITGRGHLRSPPNQKLDYVVLSLAPRDREELHPIVEQAEKALENSDGEGNGKQQ